MGPSGKVFGTQLWLLASLLAVFFFPVTSQAAQRQSEVMSAPNLLRIGTAENIFVEIQDCESCQNVDVTISVLNHPTKARTLTSTAVTLTAAADFQAFGTITIPESDFSKDPKVKQYVVLRADFPGRRLEKVVLVSMQSGYIFIQTDKTIYTPGSTVLYRLFGVKSNMQSTESETTRLSAIIEIKTPDDITVKNEIISLTSGIYSGSYKFSELVSQGQWKFVAKFANNPLLSFTAEFEVKEYVLPSFEVKLKPAVPYFYVDSEELSVAIEATYLFGEEVNGMVYAVFGLFLNGQKSSFSRSYQRVQMLEGTATVTLRKEHITEQHQTSNIHDLVGNQIYVTVNVLTESGSEMVEAELTGIPILTSPYTISFKKTPRFYKPGMSFDVSIEVLYPDETPAKNIPVLVEPGQEKGITGENGIARLAINTVESNNPLSITAKTNVPDIGAERQASVSMSALPYQTVNSAYIHIGLDKADFKLGDSIKVNFFSTKKGRFDITYLILSRGQLIDKGRYSAFRQSMISLFLPITKEMLPSFRIIAYYHTSDNKVVSDSVWVDVKDSCMGSLKLEQVKPENYYPPRGKFVMKITGDPGATVGLVAVDKGVYVLNNQHRLTQQKVWDVVEKCDTGCTPGGGQNSMNVFYDAGLLFQSGTSGTPHRLDSACPVTSRRKRATSIFEFRASLIGQYKDKLLQDCCYDGMNETPLSYNCERRSEYITDGQACVEAFLNCCNEMESQLESRKEESLLLARSEHDDGYTTGHIVKRTQFPESWLWKTYTLPSCPPNTKCDTTDILENVFLQDSITTWLFTGISLSRTHGICVADPLEIIVRRKFFIDLRLPYSAVRGEQLEIRAIIHNYYTEAIIVRVDLFEDKNLCSAASKRGKYRQEIRVGPTTTRAVPFIIIPMVTGRHPVEVQAVIKNSEQPGDRIMKLLQVVPEGVQVKTQKILSLDPARKGVDGRQEQTINSEIPLDDAVPKTPSVTQISLTGGEQMSTLLENAISGNSMSTLIQQPYGCGEQNIASMTLPVIATIYLDKTNHWEKVGFEKRDEALQHIQTGYLNELRYRKDDGSFAVFPGEQGSTWLTAYVAKVFAMAHSLVDVQNNVICDAIQFLIDRTQLNSGQFTEVGYVYSTAMRSDLLGSDSDASMTAFCLIAMQETRTICAIQNLDRSVTRAVAYLEQRLPSLNNPYAVAMTSYALANENKLNLEFLLKFASGDLSHWPVRGTQVYTLEATAYALLALVKVGAFEKAQPVVGWFNHQQKVGGGYGTTQSTIMVYQAVAEYWANVKEPEYNLNIDLLLPGRSGLRSEKIHFRQGNSLATRTSKFNDINKDVTVTATGNGVATLTMVSLYYAYPKEKESDCQDFDMSLQLTEVNSVEEEYTYKLKIEVLFKNRERSSSMAILDIGLPTGFIYNIKDLNSMSEGHARVIKKYENNTLLSEKGSLIIYLDKISNTRQEEFAFKIHQKFKIGALQPAAVSVYEYNEPKRCVKFYHPKRSGQLHKLCNSKSNECICAEEECSMQKKGKIENHERLEKACETTETSRIDFAYQVRVEDIKHQWSMDIYSARIIDVIKIESTDVAPLGHLRAFVGRPSCRESLNLMTGKTYLIMGSSAEIRRIQENETFQYGLGENTWIEYWPSDEESQTPEHRATYLGLKQMVREYKTFGCLL